MLLNPACHKRASFSLTWSICGVPCFLQGVQTSFEAILGLTIREQVIFLGGGHSFGGATLDGSGWNGSFTGSDAWPQVSSSRCFHTICDQHAPCDIVQRGRAHNERGSGHNHARAVPTTLIVVDEEQSGIAIFFLANEDSRGATAISLGSY